MIYYLRLNTLIEEADKKQLEKKAFIFKVGVYKVTYLKDQGGPEERLQ